jgi:hypothetical protein
MHHHIHFPLVAADGDAPNQSRIELHGLEELLNSDRGLAGMHEIARFDEEALLEAAHGAFHPRQVEVAAERVMIISCHAPMARR